ncbi:MAG: hypothetical protein GY934_21905, partial [Gammaproteobacteria bacterium]|nr:hypothetical protein [Gammaproteobacteria bacterium]
LNTDIDLIQTTTTTPTTTKGCGSRSETESDRIEFISWMPDDLKVSAIEKVARLEPASAQLVIDEWTGILATGRIESSPLGYLHTLVSRFESGQFRLHYAEEVAQIRMEQAG